MDFRVYYPLQMLTAMSLRKKVMCGVLLLPALLWGAGCVESRMASPRTRASADVAVQSSRVYPAAKHHVAKVHDGDSLALLSDNVRHEVRLSGIDAPEWRQPFGDEAREELALLLKDSVITFTDEGQDPYHRNLVRLYAGGRDVNLEMVRRGLAWHYRAYSRDPRLEAAEQEARRFHRGLWSQPNPQPPWEWRHAGKSPRARR